MDNIINEILELFKMNLDIEDLHEQLLHFHENDIARVFEYLDKNDLKKLYKCFTEQELADIFAYLDEPQKYIDELNKEQAADLIELMDTDDAIEVLEELSDESRLEIIELMDEEVVEEIELINSYEDDEIGSYMTNNYIAITMDLTIKQAMKKVVEGASAHDNFSIIYVLDQDDSLYGTIELKDLIRARADDALEDIIKKSYPVVVDKEITSEVIKKIKEYEMDSVAVINEKNIFLGVITTNDLLEAIDDELSDDYAKLAGLSSEEELDESTFKSVKKRMPWLCILLVLGLIISIVMQGFEKAIVAVPVIVFFQSMILGMGGNVGTQSLAVTIRAISDENIKGKDVIKLVLKELKIAILNGLVIALVSFVVVTLYLYLTKTVIDESNGFNIFDIFKTAMVVSLSLIISMLLSGLIGTIIPITLQKFKVDPAVASGPFITSINDITAIIIYYGITLIVFSYLI